LEASVIGVENDREDGVEVAFPSRDRLLPKEQRVTASAPARCTNEYPVLQQWLAVILLAVAVVSTQIATLRPGHEWGDDFAQYIQQALNLAAGRPMVESGYI
jgi:hypothetical protein